MRMGRSYCRGFIHAFNQPTQKQVADGGGKDVQFGVYDICPVGIHDFARKLMALTGKSGHDTFISISPKVR
jgi:hypothetical protein